MSHPPNAAAVPSAHHIAQLEAQRVAWLQDAERLFASAHSHRQAIHEVYTHYGQGPRRTLLEELILLQSWIIARMTGTNALDHPRIKQLQQVENLLTDIFASREGWIAHTNELRDARDKLIKLLVSPAPQHCLYH